MQTESSHDSRRREHVAPNLYRRRTGSGDRFDAAFRDTDGRLRFKVLNARTLSAAKREARALLKQRDDGDRVTPDAITFHDFVKTEFEPGIDALAAAVAHSAA
jgi:hypothetical protein